MTVASPSKRAYGSGINIDKVIYAAQKSYTPVNSIGSQTFIIPASETKINQYARPLGIYSTDNGDTWSEIGHISSSSTSLLNHATKPPITVSPSVNSIGQITITVAITSTIGGGGTFSLLIGICLLASDNPSPLMTIPNLSGKTAYASRSKEGLQSRYREILLASSQATAIGTGNVAVSHGLPYVPDVQIWYASSIDNYLQGSLMAAGGACFLVDATTLYFYKWGAAQSYLYRAYAP